MVIKKEKETKETKQKELSLFEKQITNFPSEMKEKLLKKEKVIAKIVKEINLKAKNLSMGFFINPQIETQKDGKQTHNFDKLTLTFLFDDFQSPLQEFNPAILLGEKFEKLLGFEKKMNQYNEPYFEYFLKADKEIAFVGTSVSILRENCFDAIYDDLKTIGTSIIYEDSRGFISALKTIDIHRNMLLQKFEKYIVVYAGAGSWLRGEKSNDFDVFIVIDDTDVKKMPRLQVKEQLTRMIWQMSHEVAVITGIQIHIQVYLLTDFWDALKDAHPVMFTFLRDGVPFYDRGLYSSWKELLKLGKIRPSPEAIDMHMNVGTQLVDRAKKMFNEIAMNDVYYAFLNPAQAILMLRGYNPTTPKETLKIFKEILLDKEKAISKKDYLAFQEAVKLFKELEHNKEKGVEGKQLDRMLKSADEFLKNIKKMFEGISEERSKESIISSYNELLNQLKSMPELVNFNETEIFKEFEKVFIKTGRFPIFLKDSLKSILKAKKEYETGKISTTEVNKSLKEVRLILTEIKNYKNSSMLGEISKKKLIINYDEDKLAEIVNYKNQIYLFVAKPHKAFKFVKEEFIENSQTLADLTDDSKFSRVSISEELIKATKLALKTKEIYL